VTPGAPKRTDAAGAERPLEARLHAELTHGLEAPLHHTALPHTAFSRRADAFVRAVGGAVSWVWLGLLGVIVANVTLRYVFGAGRVELEELQWHLYALGFLCGLAYTLESDGHVRIDFLRDRFAPRTQAWIELYGILLLFLPFVALVGIYAVPFARDAFARGEVSPSPGGLPLRGVIKSALPAGAGLLALAGLSRLSRVVAYLFGDAARGGERR